jgi:predicted amidophosphoribosyltransferase
LLSAAAIAKPPVYDRARAAARYSATMRELIQSFKYRDRHEGLPLFGLWLKKAGVELLAEADLIVPVPLYRSSPPGPRRGLRQGTEAGRGRQGRRARARESRRADRLPTLE